MTQSESRFKKNLDQVWWVDVRAKIISQSQLKQMRAMTGPNVVCDVSLLLNFWIFHLKISNSLNMFH